MAFMYEVMYCSSFSAWNVEPPVIWQLVTPQWSMA